MIEDNRTEVALTSNDDLKMDLKEYIRSLGEGLLTEPEFDTELLGQALNLVQADLNEIRSVFVKDAPVGLEAVRDFMSESLDLYNSSLEDMRSYAENGDRNLLLKAIDSSSEAEEIMNAIDMVIDEHMKIFTEYSDV